MIVGTYRVISISHGILKCNSFGCLVSHVWSNTIGSEKLLWSIKRHKNTNRIIQIMNNAVSNNLYVLLCFRSCFPVFYVLNISATALLLLVFVSQLWLSSWCFGFECQVRINSMKLVSLLNISRLCKNWTTCIFLECAWLGCWYYIFILLIE